MSKYAMSVEMLVKGKQRSCRQALDPKELWWRKCNDPQEQKKVNWDAISPFIPQGVIARASELPFFNSDNLVFFVGSFGVFCKKAVDLSHSVETAQLMYRVAFLKTMVEMAYCLPGSAEPFNFIAKSDVAKLRVSYKSHGFDDMQGVDADMRALFVAILGAPDKHSSMLDILERLLINTYERFPNPATKPSLQAVGGTTVAPHKALAPVPEGAPIAGDLNGMTVPKENPQAQNRAESSLSSHEAVLEESCAVEESKGSCLERAKAVQTIDVGTKTPDARVLARSCEEPSSVATTVNLVEPLDSIQSAGEPWDQAIREALRSNFVIVAKVNQKDCAQHAAVLFEVGGSAIKQGLLASAMELSEFCESVRTDVGKSSCIVFFVDEIDLDMTGPSCEGVNTRVAFEMAWPELRSHDVLFMARYLELKTGVEEPYARCVLAARAMILGRSRIGLKRVHFHGRAAR